MVNAYLHYIGFTRINKSIRIYFWTILVAQDEARAAIINHGNTFNEQRCFAQLLELAIARGQSTVASNREELSKTMKTFYERVLQSAGGAF